MRRSRLLALSSMLVLGTMACGGGDDTTGEEADSGNDVGTNDGSRPDASVPDASKPDASVNDAGADATLDATVDATTDAAVDATADVTADAPIDAAHDASSDTGAHDASDAGVDTGVDAAPDSAVDASADASPIDAAPDVAVDAAPDVAVDAAPTLYTVGVTVTGVTTAGLTLKDNGGDDLAIGTDGTYAFGTSLASGATYAVTVGTQPSGAMCTVTNGTGTVGAANVTGIAVTCVSAAGATCNAIKTKNPAAADGVYLISPSGADAFNVYCDMTTDGGGWTKILQYKDAAYTPTAGAAGAIAQSTIDAFAKLADAQINAIGGSGSTKVYRYRGDQTTSHLYVTSNAVYDDTARAMGLTGSLTACEGATYPCAQSNVTAGTTDSLAWGVTPNDCTRYFTDYFGAGQCYSTGSTTQRCFSAGVTCGSSHPLIGTFSLWVRELNYRTAVLASAPVAYWNLDESSSPVIDAIGGRVGTQFNGVTFGNPGVASDGNAAGFAGGQKIDVPYDAALNPATEVSVEAWFSVAGSTGDYQSPVTSRDDFPQRGYIIYVTPNNTIEFWTGYGGYWAVVPGPTINYGAKYHVVGTWSGGTMTLYVNGAQIGTAGGITYVPNTAQPLRIGAGATEGAGNYFFNGLVDDVAVYDHALSAGEVAQHWASGQ